MNFFTILLGILMLTGPQHVGNVAEYHVQRKGNMLHIRMLIDYHELRHFKIKEGDCDMDRMTALCVTRYINNHSSLEVNGDTLRMQLDRSATEKGHFLLYLSGSIDSTEITEIKIKNQCFYEFDSTYKNRMILNLKHFNRSYLLTQKRDHIYLRKP